MKKSSKILLSVLAALVVLTAAVAAVHLSTRRADTAGAIRVERAGETVTVAWDRLALVPVSGQIKNGKGEIRDIDAKGILLRDLISAAGFDPSGCAGAEVTAADSYYARVEAAELAEADKVYIIEQGSGGFRQVVFGDENSKRNISDVVSVTVLTD